MKPGRFDYYRPDSLAQTLDLLAEFGDDAKVLAGGQSLIPLLNMRLARPAVLIDLGRVSELRGVTRSDADWRIGAMTTQARLERTPGLPAAIAAAVPQIGHPQIRSRGTVGGSLAHLDPLAEWPALALALDATFILASRRGTRSVGPSELMVGPLTTCLAPDELLVEVRIPERPGYQGFAEVARRPGDYALVGVVLVWRDGTRPALAVFGAGPLQRRLTRVEEALAGGLRPGRELRGLVYDEIAADSDLHASGAYRRRAAAFLVDHLVEQACASISV